MKQNKLIMGAIALTMVVAMNCKKGAAGGAGDLMSAANEYIALSENAAAALDKAADGKAAAKVLMDAEATGNAMEAKFPQLKELDKSPELASLTARNGEASMKLLTALGKASERFKADPDFTEAMKKIMKTDGK